MPPRSSNNGPSILDRCMLVYIQVGCVILFSIIAILFALYLLLFGAVVESMIISISEAKLWYSLLYVMEGVVIGFPLGYTYWKYKLKKV